MEVTVTKTGIKMWTLEISITIASLNKITLQISEQKSTLQFCNNITCVEFSPLNIHRTRQNEYVLYETNISHNTPNSIQINLDFVRKLAKKLLLSSNPMTLNEGHLPYTSIKIQSLIVSIIIPIINQTDF